MAGEIPLREQFLQAPAGGGVDAVRLFGQLAFFEDAHDQAVHGECCYSLGPYLELHSFLPLFP